ncbi:unnamed protein product [Ambrosiozyma monospora]|uniref:Unnamed protein product n=1 Tax=Ambrosiozyma monospora TaxID=43982 RepID=A0ACB5T3I9_AMBMO|nr:unnamed protein product [Ambrosiozyma monospora]
MIGRNMREETMVMPHILWKNVVQTFKMRLLHAYRKIWLHNNSCAPDDMINVPQFLFSGEVTDDDLFGIEARNERMMVICGSYLVLEKLEGNLRHPEEYSEEFDKVDQELEKLAAIGIIHEDENSGKMFVIDFQLVDFR